MSRWPSFLPPVRAISALALSGLLILVEADEPVPVISESHFDAGTFTMMLKNLGPGATYYIERSTTPGTLHWEEFDFFEGSGISRVWTDDTAGDFPTAFYRITRDAYHPKISEKAVLEGRSHGVSGTARIVNNRTIEISDFNFDGGGIVVQIYISPNSSFDPYIAISDDLIGPAFVDATLKLAIPTGTDLDSIKHISVWCVVAGVSFGDGSFAAP